MAWLRIHQSQEPQHIVNTERDGRQMLLLWLLND
jgi:hypothetical protein